MSDKTIVTVNEGPIRGIKQRSKFSGHEYISFYGVPYGQPTGERLRFKDPVKVKPWKNVYDATTQREGCAQFSLQAFDVLGNEDCLYNNIYIPRLPRKGDAELPVVVHIHPGSFYHGVPEPSQYGSPDFVMQHDIIYICIGFRLHILGYLNLGLKECSGNQGLKDIILGLRWIKNNIRSFGGDPENITLLGSSTGATIIHFLMLSPAARGLFHKGVIMGKYVFGPVYRFKESHEQIAFEFAQVLGYEGQLDDKKKLLAFLKRVPPEQLSEEQYYFTKRLYEDYAPIVPMGAFLPTVDARSDFSVLPQSPRKLLDTMLRIPLMVGICDKESFMGFCRGKLRSSTLKHFKTSVRQNCWGWGHDLSDADINEISEQVESFYFNDPNDDLLEVRMNVQSDITFSDIYETLIDPVATDLPSSVYVYKFDFEGKIVSMKNITYFLFDEIVKGTVHGDDFSYWTCVESPENNETKQMIETFTKLITTFARTGSPNYENSQIEWNPTTPDKPCYLNIKNNTEMIDGKLNGERMQFWQNLKEKYGKKTP